MESSIGIELNSVTSTEQGPQKCWLFFYLFFVRYQIDIVVFLIYRYVQYVHKRFYHAVFHQ